jgi:hypothetical protein
MRCDKCWSGDLNDGTGTNIEWSEYEHKIWCYDCEIDTEGFKGIFDGPIPLQASRLLGITFDRINLETKQIERFNLETHEWDPPEVVKKNTEEPKARTKRILKGGEFEDPYGDYLAEEGSKYFKLVPIKHNSSKCQKNPKQK